MNSICLDDPGIFGDGIPGWAGRWQRSPVPSESSYAFHGYLIGQADPQWRPYVVEKLRELAHLRSNWDGYGAREIEHGHIRSILDLLDGVMKDETPAPWVIPVSDGNIQVEWHLRGCDLEIESVNSSRFLVSFEDFQEGAEEEFYVDTDLTQLSRVLDRLTEFAIEEAQG